MPAATLGQFGMGDWRITGAILQEVGVASAAQFEKLVNETGAVVDREDYDQETTIQVRAILAQSSTWDPDLGAALALSAGTLPNYTGEAAIGTAYIDAIQIGRAVRGFRGIDVTATANPGLVAA